MTYSLLDLCLEDVGLRLCRSSSASVLIRRFLLSLPSFSFRFRVSCCFRSFAFFLLSCSAIISANDSLEWLKTSIGVCGDSLFASAVAQLGFLKKDRFAGFGGASSVVALFAMALARVTTRRVVEVMRGQGCLGFGGQGALTRSELRTSDIGAWQKTAAPVIIQSATPAFPQSEIKLPVTEDNLSLRLEYPDLK